MQIVKYFILFLIFGSSAIIGRIISKRYSYRLAELEEVLLALNIFKSKIKFTYEPIPEIFEEIGVKSNKNIGDIFKLAKEKMEILTADLAWEEAIDESTTNLKKEDKDTLKNLSKLLRSNRC